MILYDPVGTVAISFVHAAVHSTDYCSGVGSIVVIASMVADNQKHRAAIHTAERWYIHTVYECTCYTHTTPEVSM